MNWLEKLTGIKKPVIGVIHLPPLPGNPKNTLSTQEIIENSLKNAGILVDNGIHALIVENYYDSPFPKYAPREEVISIISIIAWEIKKRYKVPIGVNILRNCGITALSIAHIVGGDFIRVNALSQTIVSDQGVIEPIAYELSLKRKLLGSKTKVMADVNVKHARPLVNRELSSVIKETIERGDADAIIITGEITGDPPEPRVVSKVKKYCEKTPLILGSGISRGNIHEYMYQADGFIVGTYFKDKDGKYNPRKIKALLNRHKELLEKMRL